MVTSAALYRLMWLLNVTIDIRNVCVFLAPFFSSLTTLVTYALTKEIHVSFVRFRIRVVENSCGFVGFSYENPKSTSEFQLTFEVIFSTWF